MTKNQSFIPLKRGEVHTVDDVFGMVCFQAEYRGVIEDKNFFGGRGRLLLFKIINPIGSSWAGAEADTHIRSDGVSVRFVARYYGKTPKSLKKWNETTEPKKPKWVRVAN